MAKITYKDALERVHQLQAEAVELTRKIGSLVKDVKTLSPDAASLVLQAQYASDTLRIRLTLAETALLLDESEGD